MFSARRDACCRFQSNVYFAFAFITWICQKLVRFKRNLFLCSFGILFFLERVSYEPHHQTIRNLKKQTKNKKLSRLHPLETCPSLLIPPPFLLFSSNGLRYQASTDSDSDWPHRYKTSVFSLAVSFFFVPILFRCFLYFYSPFLETLSFPIFVIFFQFLLFLKSLIATLNVCGCIFRNSEPWWEQSRPYNALLGSHWGRKMWRCLLPSPQPTLPASLE